MNDAIWAKAHGAATHFPIALTLCSGVCDLAGYVLAGRPAVRDLHAAGYWTLLLAALVSVAAVFSGLLMTKGDGLGHGALRWHHLFVWPAFGLLIALAVWRGLVGRRTTRPIFAGYLAGIGLACGLMMAAGYWGGEMMLTR